MIKNFFYIIILLMSVKINAQEIKFPDYEGESYIKSYQKLTSTFGIVKSVPESISDSKSIQEIYLNENSQQFNYHAINYFLKLNNDLKGFSPNGQLIYKIPELNNLFRDYVTNSNIVKRRLIENQYKEILKQKSKLLNYGEFENKIYYSGVPLLGAFQFDFDNLEKKIIFETQKVDYPAVYLNCYKNGEMIGLFYASGYYDSDRYLPTLANKTPIVLRFPKEISEKFEYAEKKYQNENIKNLCLRKEKFEDLNKGDTYESLISDSHNQFFVFFNIDTKADSYNYLVGNVVSMGLFSYDNSDFMHMPYFLWEGKIYNEKPIQEIIKNNLINNNNIKKGFNNGLLKNEYTYVFNHNEDKYFIKGIENGNKARLILNKTSFLAEYKVEYFEDYIELTLNKLLRDSANNFPLKIIISKNSENKQSAILGLYVQFVDRPHYFKELELNLKQGFLFDWKKNVE